MEFNDRRQARETQYHPDTHPEVKSIVDRQITAGQRGEPRGRYVFHYGDNKSGQAWGDTETGMVGRSTGDKPIPLVVHNNRSMGGGGLMTQHIVKIETARGKNTVWQHPKYQKAPLGTAR